jgi:putative transposase
MPKKRYTPEEIIQHLRTVELETSKGLAVLDACRKLGITEQTYVISCSTGSCSTR